MSSPPREPSSRSSSRRRRPRHDQNGRDRRRPDGSRRQPPRRRYGPFGDPLRGPSRSARGPWLLRPRSGQHSRRRPRRGRDEELPPGGQERAREDGRSRAPRRRDHPRRRGPRESRCRHRAGREHRSRPRRGSLDGDRNARRDRAWRAPAGVIWMDAHGDSNTPKTSPSGNVHGMPFAVAFGLAADPFPKELRGSIDARNSALIALRSVDAEEKENIRTAGVTPITMADIDRRGMSGAMEKAIAVAGRGDGIHLSLDMDAIDPDEAPGVGTPVRGGLTYREAQLTMEILAASGKLRSMEIAEVNPILDQENRTAALAVELAASALGQTIL